MKQIVIAGNTGKDAEHKTTLDGSELCSFSVAVEDGWGESKSTMWFDVTRWGKGAKGLANALLRGSKVCVTGDITTREHNGRTYLQIRADKVSILSTSKREPDGSRGVPECVDAYVDNFDDSIPF